MQYAIGSDEVFLPDAGKLVVLFYLLTTTTNILSSGESMRPFWFPIGVTLCGLNSSIGLSYLDDQPG